MAMRWWERNNLRLIQTNLREVDAAMDVDRLISELQQFSANVLMMNAGGIFAFYPTKLEYQYRTPYLEKDLLREALDKTHAAGMKFIARFDFSKAHESLFARKPDWFYRTREGREVNYNGIVHTCINGGYQQQYALQIIEEVLTGYPVDGIFFNMFGYQTSDYSSNDYGICHCRNCKDRFAAMHGMELPEAKDPEDPRYAAYQQFQWTTTREMLERIHDFVKKINPDIAVSTYNDYKVDIIRKESNTKLTRPHPVWLYSSSENVKSVEDTWDDKIISNCCINAVDLPYRFMGVSPEEVSIRLYESIASGSGLDYCIIGVFDGYTDRSSFPLVKQIYRFHKENEHYLGQLQSAAKIALVKPSGAQSGDEREYMGLFKMLKESHIPFDVLVQHQLPFLQSKLRHYQMLIVPDIREWDNGQLEVLTNLHSQGIHIAATGAAFSRPQHAGVLRILFDVEFETATEQTDAAYLDCTGQDVPELEERDWVFLTGVYSHVRFGSKAKTLLPYVPPAHFGPPERAYGHQPSDYFGAGLVRNAEGSEGGTPEETASGVAGRDVIPSTGNAAEQPAEGSGAVRAGTAGAIPNASPAAVSTGNTLYIPWQPGKLYYCYGYEDHKRILLELLAQLNAPSPLSPVSTDAPPAVELFVNQTPDGNVLVQLLNLSGFNGVTYRKPLPVGPIRITVSIDEDLPERAFSLMTGQEIRLEADEAGGRATIELDELNDYDAIVLAKPE